jgi:hypothetical protein
MPCEFDGRRHLFRLSSVPQARRRLHRVPALLAEQKNRY